MVALLQGTHVVMIGINKNIYVSKNTCTEVLESLSESCTVVSAAIE